MALLTSCTAQKESPAQRAASAQALFEQATRQFHLPAGEAQGAEQRRLQDQAATAYEELIKKYPDQTAWAAQALRGLANLRAAQTNIDAAVNLYTRVGEQYPQQDWEVLQAWKSAADLLWDAGRPEAARPFYQKIVARFDQSDAPQVVQTVVRGSKAKLGKISVPAK